MATIDTRLVDDELDRIVRTSEAIKKLARAVLERIEHDPSSFEKLKVIPTALRQIGNLDSIRKAKITHRKHDFRLIFAHWKFASGSEHVDILLAFPRKHGYRIDWKWCERRLREKEN